MIYACRMETGMNSSSKMFKLNAERKYIRICQASTLDDTHLDRFDH